MRRWVLVFAVLATGCGRAEREAGSSRASYDLETGTAAPTPATAPQIAYNYQVAYSLDSDTIPSVQAKQIALCTRLGNTRCRIASASDTNRGATTENDLAGGTTKLLVDARIATRFLRDLDSIAVANDATISSRQTDAEDVTTQIVDTDARVRAKQALADRLMKLIQTANGKVGDLIAAEKAFADTQEELDAARSMQAALRQRVAMSEIAVNYVSAEADSLTTPVASSLRSAGMTLGASIAALITFAVVAAPWVLALLIVIWLFRRFRWNIIPRWWRRSGPDRPE